MLSRRQVRKAVRKVLHSKGNSKRDKMARGEALEQRIVRDPPKAINSIGLDSNG